MRHLYLSRIVSRSALAAAWLFVTAVAAWGAIPLGTVFTYQGELHQNGSPVNNTCDCQFSLWDDPDAGVQVGPTLTFDGQGGNPASIDVSNGVFTVELDFGTGAFNGNARWLEISVACPSGSPLTPLSPRQPVTGTPYALYALDGPGGAGGFWAAAGSHISNTNAGNVGIGTSTPERVLHTRGNAVLFERSANDAGVILRNTSNGEIEALFGLRSTGLDDGYALFTDQNFAVTMALRDGNVGIGTTDPGAKLDVSPLARITSSITSGARLLLRGQATGLSFTLGAVDFVDINDNVAGSMYFQRSLVGDRLFLTTGQTERIAIDQNGNVGIGNINPSYPLTVNGDAYIEDIVGIQTLTPPATLDILGDASVSGSVDADSLSVESLGVGSGQTADGLAKLNVQGGTDTSPSGGGYLVVGDADGTNISIDNNEIMARNNGQVAPLALNPEGGNVTIAQDGGGRVGIGRSNPDRTLDIAGSLRTSQHVNIGTFATIGNPSLAGGALNVAGDTLAASFDRTGSDGIIVFFKRAGSTVGDISVSGGDVSYNAFTGSHYVWTDQALERGMLVTLTGVNRHLQGDPDAEIIYGIAPSTTANDPACLGAYRALQEPTRPAGDDNLHLVMAVGNGEMWVVDDGRGDIEPGDDLISSDVPGCAMRDDPGRFPVGHIIARAAERVRWSEHPRDANGQRRVRISVLFDSFSRGSEQVTDALHELREENSMLRARVDRIERMLQSAIKKEDLR